MIPFFLPLTVIVNIWIGSICICIMIIIHLPNICLNLHLDDDPLTQYLSQYLHL